MKVILMGNAGAGKSTMARQIVARAGREIPRLSLDEIAWEEGVQRLPLEESLRRLEEFLVNNAEWIIEGVYSDLIMHALPHCEELRFLNPGVETCVENCRRRPWEPEKFAHPQDQAAMLESLIIWVRDYEDREDDYGAQRHRELYESFTGQKREYRSLEEYDK